MLLQLFIFFQIVVIGLFLTAFFTKQEILWAVTAVISAVLMITSYHIEILTYVYNVTLGAYQPQIITKSYPYLTGLNILFFGLCLLFGLFDIFDKYGVNAFKKSNHSPYDQQQSKGR